MKKKKEIEINAKKVAVLGIVLSLILIIVGLAIRIPKKEISFFHADDNGYTEYVGGDAYNFIIEASLRGGEIAGCKAEKAIFISSGCILLVFSLFKLDKAKSDISKIKTEIYPTTNNISTENQENPLIHQTVDS